MTGTVIIERSDGVATITLHRPERKNALNRQLFLELIEACTEITNRPHEDRVVVLTGGDTCFSSGADLRSAPGSASRSRATSWSPATTPA